MDKKHLRIWGLVHIAKSKLQKISDKWDQWWRQQFDFCKRWFLFYISHILCLILCSYSLEYQEAVPESIENNLVTGGFSDVSSGDKGCTGKAIADPKFRRLMC